MSTSQRWQMPVVTSTRCECWRILAPRWMQSTHCKTMRPGLTRYWQKTRAPIAGLPSSLPASATSCGCEASIRPAVAARTGAVALVLAIREQLRQKSEELARQHGPMPALQPPCLDGRWADGDNRVSWQQAWQDAVEKCALRHRNVVAISPYSVLPRSQNDDPAYTDLLPAIAEADSYAFGRPPDFPGWTLARYRHFHRRARAVIRAMHGTPFVAGGV